MDDVHLNTSRLQPPRKPETVAPGLESKHNPLDHLAGLDRLVTPALHQSQQYIRIRPKFLQGLAVNAGSHSSHKPARLAHFNDNCQSDVLIKGDERAAQVINLGHGEPPSLSSSDDDARPPPLAPSPRRSRAAGLPSMSPTAPPVSESAPLDARPRRTGLAVDSRSSSSCLAPSEVVELGGILPEDESARDAKKAPN